MQTTVPFRSSPRSFNWQTSRQVNESPVLLYGTMVRHRSHENSWERLSLTETVRSEKERRSGGKETKYWEEFRMGRRTLEPGYGETEREGSIGHRRKGVVREGKAVRPNTSSENNLLQPNRPTDSYKGLQLYRGQESPERRSKASSDHSLKLTVSQIATLPGRHRDEDPPKHTRSPSKRNISQISTLPGSNVNTDTAPDAYSPEKCLRRNLNSTVQVENMIGPPVRRSSPGTLIVPKTQKLESYASLGQEIGQNRKTKGHVQPSNSQSTREIQPQKSRRSRPEAAKDMFAPSFRLF